MEWVILILALFFLFGRQLTTLSGQFTLDNSVPGPPNGLPAQTTQNNTNPPTAQPPTWSSGPGSCTPSPIAAPTPVSNPVSTLQLNRGITLFAPAPRSR